MRTSVLIALCLIATACGHAHEDEPLPASDAAASTPVERADAAWLLRESDRIERALATRRVTWAFEESIERFVGRLRSRHGIKAVLANDLILGDGWKTDVRCDVRDVTLGAGIAAALDSAGLTYRVRDGLLVIERA